MYAFLFSTILERRWSVFPGEERTRKKESRNMLNIYSFPLLWITVDENEGEEEEGGEKESSPTKRPHTNDKRPPHWKTPIVPPPHIPFSLARSTAQLRNALLFSPPPLATLLCKPLWPSLMKSVLKAVWRLRHQVESPRGGAFWTL